jgi:hypothetical protein
VPFAYYKRLSKIQQRIYRASDEIRTIRLPKETELNSELEMLATYLKTEQPTRVEGACRQILVELTSALKVPAVRVRVYATRPHGHWGELHGLYTPAARNHSAQIEVWMRTAQRKQVVAFKTFLRTLLHELCHHLDYELLKLGESFHTQGFYRRESSLLDRATKNYNKIKAIKDEVQMPLL